MADPEKLKKLSELDEKGLREDVLLPLLTRLGCKAPTIYHGPQERGKDIITYSHDLLGQREYIAVVAKAVDLSGSVSSSKGLREVLHQVQQCFDIPYEDLFGMTKVSIDRVWIVTSKRILPSAETSIYSTLEKNNLSNRNKLFGLQAVESVHPFASYRAQLFLREGHRLPASLSGSPKTVQSASRTSFFRQLSIPGG